MFFIKRAHVLNTSAHVFGGIVLVPLYTRFFNMNIRVFNVTACVFNVTVCVFNVNARVFNASVRVINLSDRVFNTSVHVKKYVIGRLNIIC